MNRIAIAIVWMLMAPIALLTCKARHTIYAPNVKSLQVIINDNWQELPVISLGSDDVLNISFDELSHQYHRYIYRIEHCEADWKTSEEIFESDYLSGLNNNPIDDYEQSINTTVMYTHYRMSIPNERCQLKIGGNYRLRIFDEDNDNEEIICIEFMVVNPLMSIAMGVTTNTDIDVNRSHQQVEMTLGYGNINVTNPEEQLYTVVMQNVQEDDARINVPANYHTMKALQWKHNRDLIFNGGNEYHKYEILDVKHPTYRIEHMIWNGSNYEAYPFANEPRSSYLYEPDANGAFIIRNSDNVETDRTCDYAYVNYRLYCPQITDGSIPFIDGRWTNSIDNTYYDMSYNMQDKCYESRILQKQGYYNYRYMLRKPDGKVVPMPTEGNFSETENEYHAFVYYKGNSERTWQLVAYKALDIK